MALLDPIPRSLAEAWPRALARDPDALLLVDARDGSQFHAFELDLLLRRAAGWLRARGLGPGDRIALVSNGDIETLLLCYSAMCCGVVPVLLHPGAPAAQALDVARATSAALVLHPEAGPLEVDRWVRWVTLSAELPEAAPAPLGQPDPDREAVILFSSGSTGPARGVRLSHRALLSGVARVSLMVDSPPGERVGVPALFHTITGLRCALLGPALDGSVGVLLSADAGPAALLHEAASQEVAVLHAGPGFAAAVARAPERLAGCASPALRLVVIGGGGLSDAERVALPRALSAPLYHTYGMTETAGTTAFAAVNPLGEGGPLRPLVPARVVLEAGGLAPAGAVGWVEVAPDPPMIGYLGAPDLEPDAQGQTWVRPGDLGWLDEGGGLHIAGRAARQHVAPSGEKVLLDDLEAVMRDALGVEVVAASVRVQGRGPRIGALVQRPALTDVWLAHARAALAERLPSAAMPAWWVATPALPRLPGGKVDLQAASALLEADPCG